MTKCAILNMADTGATESTALMLEAAGYIVALPDKSLLRELRKAGLENVLDPDDLHHDWGYAIPEVHRRLSIWPMGTCDLFVDTKAHVNYPKIVARWPNLRHKILWCCLNGGDPMKRTDGQPWADPPCPVLTNNQWYSDPLPISSTGEELNIGFGKKTLGWEGRAYVCYPPYVRWNRRHRTGIGGTPLCLVHNVMRWGYGELVEPLRNLGVRCCGGGDCPDGILPHERAMEELSSTICLVHLKVGDTVGYAVVEAMACGTPVVCTQHYIDECRLGSLLQPDVTCLTFDPKDAVRSLASVLERLKVSDYNRWIGSNGRSSYESLTWKDPDGFRDFLRRNFP